MNGPLTFDRMSSLATRLVGAGVGAAAGLAATAAMTAVMGTTAARDQLGTPPPEKIVEHAAPGLDDPGKTAVAGMSHFVFGSAAGAVFGVLGGWRRRPLFVAGVDGVAFGLWLWAISYEGWIPALGILPPAHRDRRTRTVTMIVAHVVYGAVLGVLTRRPPRR